MQVKSSGFTIAQYCHEMQQGTIIINREYQRSEKVWPAAARSYLIDTILLRYPIPKISLYQKTDLKSRKTIYEIVDGQQRSKAILDFFDGKLQLSGPSEYSGRTYSDLNEEDQQKFVEYQLDADIFVAATDDEIRQMFRRINSYTVPLNPEEQRHATYQGAFKWFIVKITQAYASTLKRLGVFSERNLSRMQDAKLFTELVLALTEGIQTYSKGKLDKLYRDHDNEFPEASIVRNQIDTAFERILSWEDLHNGPLMKPFNFYCLLLALIHYSDPVPKLQEVYPLDSKHIGPDEIVVTNLAALANALEQDEPPKDLREFFDSCAKATNTIKQRETRFRWFCKALGQRLIV